MAHGCIGRAAAEGARGRERQAEAAACRCDGRRLRIFNVIDDVTRECLPAVVDTSISGKRVARELATVVARRGKPELIVSDHMECVADPHPPRSRPPTLSAEVAAENACRAGDRIFSADC